MRFEQELVIRRPPQDVFDYVTDAANLASWQTTKTLVEPLTDGPSRLGTRVRERTKPARGVREFEQIVEFTEFDRPNRVHVHIVEGPQPIDGTWTFTPDGDGTRLHCVVEGELRGTFRLLAPITSRAMARSFREYHENLRRNLERG